MNVSVFKVRPTASKQLDPALYVQRAKAFESSLRSVKQATLLAVTGDDGTLDAFLVTPPTNKKAGRGAASLAANLAATIDAVVEPCDDVPDLLSGLGDRPCLVSARVRLESVAGRDTAAGADPAEVAKVVSRANVPGAWVAFTMRTPRPAEVSAYRTWVSSRGGNESHYSRGGELLATSILVGAPVRSTADDLLRQVVAAMPGLDITADPVVVGSGSLPWLLGAGSAGVFGAQVAGVVPALGSVSDTWPLALGLSVPAALGAHAALRLGGRNRLLSRLDGLDFPAPRRTAAKHQRRPATDSGGVPRTARVVYPLDRSALLCAPHMLTGLAVPPGGSASGPATASSRLVPASLRAPIGPMLGADADGNPAHLSADDLYGGVGLLGMPGFGKSVAMRACLGWVLARRIVDDRSCVIVFENKGDGATACLRMAQGVTGDPDSMLLIDLADASTPAIDVFAFPGTASQKAARFIEAARYAFGEGTLENASIEALNAVLPAALWLSDHGHGNPIALTHRLLGGFGDTPATELAAVVRAAAVNDESAVEAAQYTEILFGANVSASTRRTQSQAARNKLAQLAEIETWWDPSRARVSWEDVLTNYDAVVVNLGTAADGTQVSDRQTQLLSSLLLFLLREAIGRVCVGWRDQGRQVNIFADELSVLAGSSPETVTWLRDTGRSYGVRPFFATQYPQQLHERVRSSLLGFATMLWFGQDNPEIVKSAVADLTLDGSDFTGADIAAIPLYYAVLRTRVDGVRQSPCLIGIGDWEMRGDWARFLTDQQAAPGEGVGDVDERVPVLRGWVRPGVQRAVSVVDVRDDSTVGVPVAAESVAAPYEPDRFSPDRFNRPIPNDPQDW
ncbi:hypothetical protein [Branchiibius cervicis]|uniref:TraD/TraG TraM recognition site domain-containing protein n=1 Tax=Branchiibius cervicis TaxID=908252 RepID=A0ABW2ATZ8_9MICO